MSVCHSSSWCFPSHLSALLHRGASCFWWLSLNSIGHFWIPVSPKHPCFVLLSAWGWLVCFLWVMSLNSVLTSCFSAPSSLQRQKLKALLPPGVDCSERKVWLVDAGTSANLPSSCMLVVSSVSCSFQLCNVYIPNSPKQPYLHSLWKKKSNLTNKQPEGQ